MTDEEIWDQTMMHHVDSRQRKESTMRIIFVGDWLKINGMWRQVADIRAGDEVMVHGGDLGLPVWINAESREIERVMSDPEMQKIMECVQND